MREWVVDAADAGMRLDKWLATRTEARSRSRAAEWLTRGKVFVGGAAVDSRAASRTVTAGLKVGVWVDRPGSSKAADRAVAQVRHLLTIVHEDAGIIVVDKPAGLIVEPLPGRAGEEPTLLDLVRDRDRHSPRSRAYVVHRIDRDTSGLVLFARTAAVRDALKAQFERHSPERRYLAFVEGQPSPAAGAWRDMLSWDPKALRQRKAHGTDARGKAAEATYKVIETLGRTALIEVTLITGKRNQIRVQAALRGHPLIGEKQYRFEKAARLPGPSGPGIDFPRQALHAAALGFVHPVTGRKVRFESPLPEDLAHLRTRLRTPD